ncbi:hypothetical protein [Aquisalimonas asiatica]|uniref:Uncharacterized protein n=1 Tax=Aquisalimonas asiatica TaxID=406100 RepID=A0A1H8VH70_9GAMM|nr:hypothetical protein [Aquisalimonas asiatica]SEP14802.1 hypothetical protein SAMN04488052_11278 [Aquisalimonas asiatica]
MTEYVQAEIPPRSIEHYFPRRTRRAKALFALNGVGLPPELRRGGWDRRVHPMTTHPTYRLMATLHGNGFDAATCYEPLVQYYIERGRDEAAARAHADRRIDYYMENYGGLCRNLQEQGYRADAADNQVGVAIDREGRFIKVWEGHHRFALAHILDLDRVTTDVRWVHLRWYRRFAGGRRVSSARLQEAVQAAAEQAWQSSSA